VAPPESCFHIQLGGEDSFPRESSSCRDAPVDDPFECPTEKTWHQFFFVDSAVDGGSRLPFPALVVGHSIFRDYLASFVDCFLQLNVEGG
jgi:hypothetical protein